MFARDQPYLKDLTQYRSAHSIDSVYNENLLSDSYDDDDERNLYTDGSDMSQEEGVSANLLSHNSDEDTDESDESNHFESSFDSNSNMQSGLMEELNDNFQAGLQNAAYASIIDEPFQNPEDDESSEISYSDDDTYSVVSEQDETVLMKQQKKLTFDYKRQEEHENALKDMYTGMKKARSKRKATKKVRGVVRRVITWTSNWILGPDKFWGDILFSFLTYFQIAGLLWIFPYIFPSNVYRFTQFAVYFNLDFVSHRENYPNLITWGLDNPPFYPFYLTIWLIGPPLLFAFWLALPYIRTLPVIRSFYYELDRVIFTLLRVLYLPFLLHTYAYGVCGGKGNSAFQCAAFCPDEFGWCLTRSVPAALASIFYGVGVPLAFCLQVRNLIIYARNTRHMGYVANMEVEKLLKISNNYVIYRTYLISSYTRLGSYYVYIKEAIQKATLVIIWASLDGRDNLGAYSWRSQVAISSFAFAVIVGPLIVELTWRPYRNLTLLLFNQLLGWVHVMNVMLGWFLALDVRSPFLLASQLTILILIVNVTILLVGFTMMVLILLLRVKWPINDRVINELETFYNHYLKAIRNGYMLYAHALTTNPSFVRCDLLSYHKEYMQHLYQEAVMERNPLEDTIEDCILKLEEEHYANQNLTILPHKGLQQVLPSLRKSLDRRETEMILIPTRKRILLLKVLALRRLLGNLPVKRVRIGEKPPEDIDTPRDDETEESVDFSTMDKLQAFLDQYEIHLSSSDDDEKSEKDDIDNLLEEASQDETQSENAPTNDGGDASKSQNEIDETDESGEDLLSSDGDN